jgi:hypothetical protein
MIKKIIIFLTSAFLLLICFMFAVINYVNYDTVSNNFAQGLRISPANIAKIKLTKLPIPHLNIDYIKEDGFIELENIEIHFIPLSLLTFKPQISSIKIQNAKIYSTAQTFSIINHDEMIAALMKNNIRDINFDVKNLTILNQNNQALITLNNCNLNKANPLSNITSFKGAVGNIVKFSGNFETKGTQTDFKLKITNADYDFHLSETYKDSRLYSGKGEYVIRNIANLLHQLMPDLDSIARKLKKSEIISIKFDIAPTEQLLKLENLKIDSNPFSGSGVIHLSKYDNVTSTVKLHIAKVDTKALLTASGELNKLTNSTHGVRFIFGIKSVVTDILIDQIMLNNNEILKDTKLVSNLENGTFFINDCSGTIDSGGGFKFVGKITQNAIRSIFDGKMYLQHNDLNSVLKILGYEKAASSKVTPFTLSSDLNLTLIDIYLQNILLQIEDTKVSGKITTRFIGSMPHIIATLDFSSMDLNKTGYPVLSPIIDFTKSLLEDMKNQSYLNKYIPIRAISFLGILELDFNDLLIDKDYFGKTYILANISPGNIEISNFDIRKGYHYLNASANLSASALKPQLSVKINDGNVNVDFLTPKSMLNLRNKLLKDFDLGKIDLSLSCNLSKVVQDSLDLYNLKVSLNNDNNLFTVSEISGDVFAGKLKAAGNINLNPYSINFVYALNSIDLTKLSAALPKNWLDTYGGLSINGSLSTTGDSLERLLYDLSANSEFLIKNARINNFSIDQLVEKINNKTYDISLLKSDIDKAVSEGQTELVNMQGKLKLKNGIVSMNDAVFNTKYTTGSVASAINIYNFQIALSSIFSFYVKEFSKDNVTENDKNNTSSIKVDATGSIFSPVKTPDSTELTKTLDKNLMVKP